MQGAHIIEILYYGEKRHSKKNKYSITILLNIILIDRSAMETILNKSKGLAIILVLLFFVMVFGHQNVIAAEMSDDSVQNEGNGAMQIQNSIEASRESVPVTIGLSDAVAGAELKLSYTEGLELIGFEKSDETSSAMIAPIVKKDGYDHVGIFTKDNDYAPNNGELFIGYLVFEYDGTPNQAVTINEAKLVKVIDKDNTESEVRGLDLKINVPTDEGIMIGTADTLMMILIVALAALVVIIAILVTRKKKLASK